jgi:hypothetical protein
VRACFAGLAWLCCFADLTVSHFYFSMVPRLVVVLTEFVGVAAPILERSWVRCELWIVAVLIWQLAPALKHA